jgi:DNA-binding beta-propeller fold protein YncE
MLSKLSPRLGRIFRSALVLFLLCTSVNMTFAQFSPPAERPNSLYRIADRIPGPAGIVRKNTQLWVVAEDSHRIVVLSQKGQELYSVGNGGCGKVFCYPVGIALDSQGDLYVGDTNDAVIRKVSKSSEFGSLVETVAGHMLNCGTENAINGAALCHPAGVVVDKNDDLYVVDTNLHAVRKIRLESDVRTIAGNLSCGGVDGPGKDASFCRPRGIAIDAANNLYVADTGNSTVRKITPEGAVSTIAGMAGVSGYADGGRAPDGTSTARFDEPTGIAFDNLTGDLYVADTQNATIRKITPDGQVTTVAGKAGITKTAPGTLPGTMAKPRGIAVIGPRQLAVSTDADEVLGITF